MVAVWFVAVLVWFWATLSECVSSAEDLANLH